MAIPCLEQRFSFSLSSLRAEVICENYDFPSVGHFIVFVVNITFKQHEILSLCSTLSRGIKVVDTGLK